MKRRTTKLPEQTYLKYRKRALALDFDGKASTYTVRGSEMQTRDALADIEKASETWAEWNPWRWKRCAGRPAREGEWVGKNPLVPMIRAEVASVYNGIRAEHRRRFVYHKTQPNLCIEWEGAVRKRDGAPIIKRPKYDTHYFESVRIRGAVASGEAIDDLATRKAHFQEWLDQRRKYPVRERTERPSHLRSQVRVDLLLKNQSEHGGCRLIAKTHYLHRTCGNQKCVNPRHLEVRRRA